VWCPGQNKRITTLFFFHGCRMVTKGLISLIPEIDCDQMVIGLPPVKSAVYLIPKQFWYNVGVTEEYLRCLRYSVSDMYVTQHTTHALPPNGGRRDISGIPPCQLYFAKMTWLSEYGTPLAVWSHLLASTTHAKYIPPKFNTYIAYVCM
jgi:hypothetical protein